MGAGPVADSVRAPTDEYRLTSTLDLKEDRKAALTVQAGFAVTVAVMVALVPLLDLPMGSAWPGVLVAGVTVVACLAYMVAHELTHGLLLWWLTGARPSFAVRLPYLVTGSQELLTRRVAVTVSLAPLVLWSLVLLSLLPVVPPELFLTWYVVLALNLAASAGDVLQAWLLSHLPRAVRIRDDGRQTTVWVRDPVA